MKTRISFPHYPDVSDISVPNQNLLGVFAPQTIAGKLAVEEVIRQGLTNPIGSLPLNRLAGRSQRILILLDDNTRTTPIQLILPAVIAELNRAGVPNDQIELLVALGTHRPMTDSEQRQKFGGEICDRFAIHMHQWNNAAALYDLGTTESGTFIQVNSRLMEADLVIGVGQIVPHRVAGFSGGAKIVQPGVCGGVTTGQTHWLSAKFKGEEIMGKIDNAVRAEINQVGIKANLKFIVNAVMDLNDEIVELACGDPIAAFRAGAMLSRRIFGVEIPCRADIVIADSYPADLEMWQASKGIYASDLAVRDGGVIIMVSPCYEGVCAEHPDVLKYGYPTYSEVQRLVDCGEIADLTLAAHLIHVGRVIREKARTILVSSGIEASASKALGFIPVDHPQEALEKAFALVGKHATVCVLQHAGHILPIIRQ